MFLATGLGRSGTGWFARFMTELGHSCTHEGQYNPWRAGPLTQGESSWLAVPYLPDDVPIVYMDRDPELVTASMIRIGFLRNLSCPYARYVDKHQPEVFSNTSHEARVRAHVEGWTRPLAHRNRVMLRVGDSSVKQLQDTVQYCTGSRPDPGRIERVVERIGRVNVRR